MQSCRGNCNQGRVACQHPDQCQVEVSLPVILWVLIWPLVLIMLALFWWTVYLWAAA